jgi:hypothetical protein
MRAVHIYLIVYLALIVAAAAVLWRSDVLQHMPLSWALTAAGVALVLGVLLAILSRTPAPAPSQE